MRRALLALIATSAIVFGLLHYKTTDAPRSLRIALGPSTPGPDPQESQPPSPIPPATSAAPSPSTAAIVPAVTKRSPSPTHPAASTKPSPSPTRAVSPSPSAAASRTITGPVEDNQYGPVQVQITVSGSRITAVKTLQLPTDRARSAYISSVAGPMLVREATQAQSANIDSVSGASFTSYSFAESLQAAISQAGLSTS